MDVRPDEPPLDSYVLPDEHPCGHDYFDIDEGGEVRVEHVTSPSRTGARGTAFVYKNPGVPAYHDFINQLGTCVDTRMKGTSSSVWPFAQNADREYFDLGPEVDVLGTGMTPLRLAKTTNATQIDPLGRTHALWYSDDASNGDAFLSAATSYDVVFPGSPEFPAAIFDDGIYIPNSFDLLTPAFGDPVSLSANTDLMFTWEVAQDAPPSSTEVLSIVELTGPNGPAVVCIEPNDGSITVPAPMVDIARAEYPSGGTVVRQTFTHQVREVYAGSSDVCVRRRLDLIGAWSFEQPFAVN